jgi:nucleoside phosphorylase
MTSVIERMLEELTVQKELTPEERNLYLRTSVNLRKKATEHIRIAVITALPKERAAMSVMLDDLSDWPFPGTTLLQCEIGKIESLANGRIHNVLLTQALKMGNNSAAITATQVIADFPNIADILMVGIAGGIPNLNTPTRHVRLGDVIVSRGGGVIQYDFIKVESSEKPTIRSVAPPPSALLQGAVDKLETRRLLGEYPWESLLDRARELEDSARPSPDYDVLHSEEGQIPHPDDPGRRFGRPKIHYGTIGSANSLLKNRIIRDKLRDELQIVAVEMEGSGIADAGWASGIGGYLLIRGACDYCDEHKNDLWQGYAAVAAAAYARALIQMLPA